MELYTDLRNVREKAEKNIDECINLIGTKNLLDNPEMAFVFGKMIELVADYADFSEKFVEEFDELRKDIREINENVKKQRKEP